MGKKSKQHRILRREKPTATTREMTQKMLKDFVQRSETEQRAMVRHSFDWLGALAAIGPIEYMGAVINGGPVGGPTREAIVIFACQEHPSFEALLALHQGVSSGEEPEPAEPETPAASAAEDDRPPELVALMDHLEANITPEEAARIVTRQPETPAADPILAEQGGAK